MRYIQIPQLEKPVSVLGLGTVASVFSPGRYEQAAELLDRFLDAGGNCIDTAHIYGFGDSEKTLGRWFRETGRRDAVVLITKGCHPDVDRENILGGPWTPRLTPEAIRQDLGESLERLQTEYIDLYLLHRDDETVPVGPLVEALNQEQRRGRIHAFGVSNWRVERIAAANTYAADRGLNGVAASSPNLSLARPEKMLFPGNLFADEATRQWHRATQMPLLAWSALAGGFLSGRYTPDTPASEDITQVYYTEENFKRLRRAQTLAGRKNATLPQVALAYVLAQPFPAVALAGPTTASHLESALGAVEVELAPGELEFLERS